MTRLVIKYPNSDGAQFDFEYYTGTHIPMSQELMGDYGMGHFEILRGQESVAGEEPAFVCITQIDFPSAEQIKAALATHGEALKADFANYTNVTPIVTICEPLGRG